MEFGEPPQKMQKRQDLQQLFNVDAQKPKAEDLLTPILSLDQIPNLIDMADQSDWNQTDLLEPQQTHQKLHHQGKIKISSYHIILLHIFNFIKRFEGAEH